MSKLMAWCLLATVLSDGALAQALSVDAEIVRACHDSAPFGETNPDCLGQAANVCQEQDGGGTTVGTVECVASEHSAWDALLNEEYQDLRAVFSARTGGGNDLTGEELNASLLNAQRAWIAFRDAECGLQYDRYRGGTIRGIVGANCKMVMTASRALTLRDMAGE
ncbi:MAG: lysozyme inhibitor LprI family protein [Pseudomonadota bacterium]